jgi:ABC-type hemin transport system ATPase subunit
MDGLTGYQQRRLELADMIRAVLPIAHAHGDEQREQQIRGLLTRLAADRFQLAVIGQFSRGKTTLMNALLGEAYLPTGALPITSVVTTVRYGTRDLASAEAIHRPDFLVPSGQTFKLFAALVQLGQSAAAGESGSTATELARYTAPARLSRRHSAALSRAGPPGTR